MRGEELSDLCRNIRLYFEGFTRNLEEEWEVWRYGGREKDLGNALVWWADARFGGCVSYIKAEGVRRSDSWHAAFSIAVCDAQLLTFQKARNPDESSNHSVSTALKGSPFKSLIQISTSGMKCSKQ